ncbi:hypothetical protein BDD21_1746 [Thiocapsa rosea]|uniref:Uncharacterized protein n=1 Tax=Thiocapsa rosea TaxID=69360 RepID=A0A495V4N2_9GAMM|nr:hypothetical protein BDD21_1746 [Thiocapsa rosea]
MPRPHNCGTCLYVHDGRYPIFNTVGADFVPAGDLYH